MNNLPQLYDLKSGQVIEKDPNGQQRPKWSIKTQMLILNT